MRTLLTGGAILLVILGWSLQSAGGESTPSPKLPPPCPQMNDECFAALEKDHLSRGGIGAQIQPVRQAGEFYTFVSVEPGGAAERGGLKPGDRILAINGQKLLNSSQAELEAAAERFHETMLNLRQGETITFGVLRDGQELPLAITAGPRSPAGARTYLRLYLQIRHGVEWRQGYDDYLKRHPATSP